MDFSVWRNLLLTFLLRLRPRILPTYSYLSTRLHGVTSQKTVIFNVTLNRNVWFCIQIPATALFSILLTEAMGEMGRLLELVTSSVLTMAPCVVQLNQSCSLLFKQSRPTENWLLISTVKYSRLAGKVGSMYAYNKQGICCPYNCHESVCGSEGMAPLFLRMGMRWKAVVSITPQPLYVREMSFHYTLQGGWKFSRRDMLLAITGKQTTNFRTSSW